MRISFLQLAAIIQSLIKATREQQPWLAIDGRIQQLSANDIHFFETKDRALDFQLFNQSIQKQVLLLPTSTTLQYIQDEAARLLRSGQDMFTVVVDPNHIQALYHQQQFAEKQSALTVLMDAFDWQVVFYDPFTANTPVANMEDKIAFNRLEYLIEQLSGFALSSPEGYLVVSQLMERYWNGTLMEAQQATVLSGHYINHHETFLNHKNHVMNTENLAYLQRQLLYAGFGEGLNTQLERQVKEGLPDFQLQATHAFGKDQMEAVLYFSKSKQADSDMYFFNKYHATLNKEEGALSQTFYINNKGQSITFKEAANLLNGRSVYKELMPKEGEKYKAWVNLDFSNRDEDGNAKLAIYHDRYGFDLKEAVGRLPLKELGDSEQLTSILESLQKGNLTNATLLKGGDDVPVQLTTDPKFKTLKMYDMDGAKLFVPAPQQSVQYGQAPVDAKREASGVVQEVGQVLQPGHHTKQRVQPMTQAEASNGTTKKKILTPKTRKQDQLMHKTRTRKTHGKGVA